MTFTLIKSPDSDLSSVCLTWYSVRSRGPSYWNISGSRLTKS